MLVALRVALAATLASGAASAAYATVPWPAPSAKSLNVTLGYGTVTSTGTRFNYYIATLDDLSRFSIRLPSVGCAGLVTTTVTANEHGCVLASNSGYFQFSPKPTYCLGEIVVDGVIEEWANDGAPMLSVSASNRATYIGPLTRADVAALNVSFAVAAFGAIVLDGRPHAAGIARARATARAVKPTAEEVAPRTVFALDARGALSIIAIDGVEALNMGLTLTEAAEVFSGGATGFPYSFVHALNEDGGGSTTMVTSPSLSAADKAYVFNRPTSSDTGPIVERAVTSIACVSP